MAATGTAPPVKPRNTAEVAPRSGTPGMARRSGAVSLALGRVEVAAKGNVPQVRPRSTEVGVMETAEEVMVVEVMGSVEEEMAAAVKVVGEMGMVEWVTVEEETAAVVAGTVTRTSCT